MLRKIGLSLINIYQAIISPLLGSNKCRYKPSCSAYGKIAIQEHGVIKGSYLIGLRLLRCNPLFVCGVDPVPRKFNYRQVKK